MLSKNDKYKDALKCFEHAQKFFAEKSKSNQNLGVAQCLAAQGYLIFSKFASFLSKGEDETKLLTKASERLSQARDMFKAANHLGGQAFCCTQLGVIFKKLKKNYLNFYEDIRWLKKAMLSNKANWIQRYEGEELSLMIEIIDSPQLGINDSSHPVAVISK